ncbi:MAG TPA: RDD family protein [Geothermobacteraceae bacterium]|nr:RDD family protein [Geothermobacteraceae bacterium]
MKCPKCGFTSFDFLENCKKCGVDLQAHKSKFGLRSLIFPGFQSAEPAPSLIDDASEAFADAAAETEAADFGFDFMNDDEPAFEEPALADDELADPVAEEDAEVFGEEALDIGAEADEDDLWVADETPSVPTETVEEEIDVVIPADEGEIDFDNWESEVDEEEIKPPRPEEGPSDPFDFRESAGMAQTPETSDLEPGLEERAEAEDPTCPATEPVTAATSDLPELWSVTLTDAADEELFTFAEPELETDDAGLPTATEGQATEHFEQPELFPEPEPELEEEPVLLTASAASDELNDAIEFPPGEENAEDIFAVPGSADLTPASLEEAVPIPALAARVSACLTDLLILAGVFVLFLVVGEMTVPDPDGRRLFPALATLFDLAVPYFLVLFALCFSYFTLFHFLTGQTPGKMLFRLRVESITGEPLLFSQAFLRSTGGLFSLLAVGVGYLIAAFNQKGRGWNDLLAGSRMVPLFAEEIDEEDLSPFEI